MEQTMMWIALVGTVVLPILGWIINTLVTNKIDALNERCKKLEDNSEQNKQEYYGQLNGLRKSIEENYVRRDIYEQAMKFHSDKNDAEFKSLLSIVNTQFASVEGKIDDLKDLITEKINGQKQKGI